MDYRTKILVWAVTGPIIGFGVGFLTPSNPRQDFNVAGFTVASDHREFRSSVRKLFENHVFWNRQLMGNIADNAFEEKNNTTLLILANGKEISHSLIGPYRVSGLEVKLQKAMQDHFTIEVELIENMKKNNKGKVQELQTRWFENADTIAGILEEFNSNWDKTIIKNMLRDYMRLTQQEAASVLAKDSRSIMSTHDKVREQSLMIADVLSSGLIKKSPALFQ